MLRRPTSKTPKHEDEIDGRAHCVTARSNMAMKLAKETNYEIFRLIEI